MSEIGERVLIWYTRNNTSTRLAQVTLLTLSGPFAAPLDLPTHGQPSVAD